MLPRTIARLVCCSALLLPVATAPARAPVPATGKSKPRPAVPTARPLRLLKGHAGTVHAVAFSPDGKRLASASNRELILWEVATGKKVYTYPTKGTNVFGLAFSPDGKQLALGIGRKVQLLDAATGKPGPAFASKRNYLFRLAFHPSGKRLAVAGGQSGNRPGDVHVWDLATGREVLTLSGHGESVLNVAYTPDGKHLVSSSGGTSGNRPGEVRVWEAATGRLVSRESGLGGNVYALACSPDGQRVASGWGVRNGTGGGEIRVWERASGREVLGVTRPKSTVFALDFSPDGNRLLSAEGDRAAHLWDVATGQEVLTLRGHTKVVYAAALGRDGRLAASAGMDGTVRLWDLTGLAVGAGPPLSAGELRTLWGHLAGGDAPRAYHSGWKLSAGGARTVAFLEGLLRPARPLCPDRQAEVPALLRDLDAPDFATREKATVALTRMGEAIVPSLRKALKGGPSPEVRRRLAGLLREATHSARSPERLQALRGIEILERIGSPRARRVLGTLAAGAPESCLTRQARASLDRLGEGKGGTGRGGRP